MGPEAQLDPDVEPDQPGVVERDRYYDRVPRTANAEVDELAVEPAGPRTPGAYPNVLDDIAQPDAVRLNLEELLAFAIGNSPDYRAEKEELYLAALSLIIERHLWGPRFFTAVTGRLTGSPESNDTEAAASVIGSLGVTQRLPYGGTVSATALADYVTFLREAADDGDENTASVGVRVSLDLPLLRGAGINSPAYNDRIQAERNLIYAVREFERFRRAFLVDLATQYFDILRRQRQIANRQRQLRSLDRLTAQFKALAEAGRVPPVPGRAGRAARPLPLQLAAQPAGKLRPQPRRAQASDRHGRHPAAGDRPRQHRPAPPGGRRRRRHPHRFRTAPRPAERGGFRRRRAAAGAGGAESTAAGPVAAGGPGPAGRVDAGRPVVRPGRRGERVRRAAAPGGAPGPQDRAGRASGVADPGWSGSAGSTPPRGTASPSASGRRRDRSRRRCTPSTCRSATWRSRSAGPSRSG